VPEAEAIALGEVRVPSGDLVIFDLGYLELWSGEQPPPAEFAHLGNERLRAFTEASKDYAFDGPDAEEAARVLNLQWGPFIYDIPDVAPVEEKLEQARSERGLDAALRAEAQRVPHRERVRRATAMGGSGFAIDGVYGVAVPVPRQRPVQVRAIAHQGFDDLWSRVEVRITGSVVASSTLIGYAGVDWARLTIADADALGSWKHHEPLDGLADVSFWGRDHDAVRDALGGDALPDGTYGWQDLSLDEAVERVELLEAYRRDHPEHGFAVDQRPHSHHHAILERMKASPTHSAILTFGDADILGSFTGWGDGVFPIFLDVDGAGAPVSIRILLGEDANEEQLG
jgi:hypothetical protein